MKTILFTFTSLLLIISCAQDNVKGNGKVIKETRNVGQFNEIETGGNYDVYIYDAPQDGKIIIEAESNVISTIETEVDGDKLIIRKKKGFNLSTSKQVKIYINAKNLKSIGASGSGSVTAEGVQNVDNFSAGLSGSGNIKVKINAKTTHIGVSGSGDLDISGKTDNVDIGISGSADVEASNLEAQNVTVGISGSGNSNVWASKSLKGAVSGSGDIGYKGEPEVMEVQSSGSGDIHKM